MHQTRTAWPVTTRVSFVVAYEHLKRQHPRLSGRRFAAATEVPYATFARWWRRFQRQGAPALRDGSHRPHHSPTALAGSVLDTIRRVHHALGFGARRLHAHLRQAGLVRCSASSVYRVLRRAGLLTRQPRPPKRVWQRYAKAFPGERAQLDLKYLPQGRYQLTLIDDCSRLLAAAVLTGRTAQHVAAALPGLLASFPFPVQCLQTDNGSEFFDVVPPLLARLGIRHTRIRPRCPHLNGKVERVQRTCQEELWDGVPEDGSLLGYQQALAAYLRFYNHHRLHSALAYHAPARYAHNALQAHSPSHLS